MHKRKWGRGRKLPPPRSGRADLLPHEDRVTDPEADEGDRDQRDHEGRHDHDTLEERERVLEAGEGDSLHRPHQHEGARRLAERVEDRRGRVPVKRRRGEERSRPLDIRILHEGVLGLRHVGRLVNGGDRIGEQAAAQTDEEGEADPDGERRQRRGGCAPEDDGEEDRRPQPEGDVEDAGDKIDRKTQHFF